MNPEKAITLRTHGLHAGYGKGIVLSDVTLEVRPGEILTLIGPNGAGKSTLLKTIAGQLAPMGGTILLDEKALEQYSGNALAKKLSILMTGQLRSELMTCRDVVETGRYPYTGRLGLLTEEDRKCVSEAMGLTGVLDLGERQFSNISDGQRQLVLLARAICQEPKVLILDEPTSYLDIRHKLELMHVLRELARSKQIAVIQSLHELELAQKCADFLLCIRNGVVDRMGTPEEIFSDDYISRLYGLRTVGFSNTFASAELPAPEGSAQVFVIAGGGTGIPIYRRLQRQGIPFAAGILWESDLDYPVAAALSREILSIPFGGIPSEEILQQAREMIDRTAYTLCTLSAEQLQGTAAHLRELKDYAVKQGKLRTEVDYHGL